MKLKRSPWIIFATVAVAQFMVVLDNSITNVALPSIERTLHFSPSSLQWVVTAYALTFGGFLLLGGRAADLFGRRKTLLLGMSAFTTVSLLIGFSQSELMLIALRAIQGAAAAIMSPSALSIVLNIFPEGKERNKALGLWTTVATGGAALGLLLGGFLTQFFGWEWNFFINVPIGILVIFAILRFVPVHENEEENKSIDALGAVLVTSGIVSFVFAVSQSEVWGLLDIKTLSVMLLSLLLLSAFVYNESKVKHPLMPLSIFSVRNIVGANLMIASIYATMLGTFYLLTLYVQNVLHYSPLVTGLSFLPFPLILGIMSTKISSLVSKHGYKKFLTLGPLIIMIGLLWASRVPIQGNYFIDLLPINLIMPLGIGMTMMPIFAAATAGVSANESGLASGLITTSQQMGGALGLAILSIVAASITGGNLSSPEALVAGYGRGFLVAAFFTFFASLIGFFVIKKTKNK